MDHAFDHRAAAAAVRVVVVDDSLLMRELLQSALTEAGDIVVVGTAANPHLARDVIRATDPDVVTLDIEMPCMGGLEFLSRIMKLRPMPVVMVAGSTISGAETTLTALEIGAVDFVAKPNGRAGWNDFAATVRYKVREAANVRFKRPAALANVLFRAKAPAQAPPRTGDPGGRVRSAAGRRAGRRRGALRPDRSRRFNRWRHRDQPAACRPIRPGTARGAARGTAGGHRPAHAAWLYRPLCRTADAGNRARRCRSLRP